MNAPAIWRLDRAAMAAAVGSLAGDGVVIVELDAGAAETSDELHRALAVALGFEDHDGRNLDALHDCLGELITDLPPGGLAVVLHRFAEFEARGQLMAAGLLDVIGEHVRDAGGAMVCIVETGT